MVDPMPKNDSSKIVPIPRENPFMAISKMVKTSVGRLPGHLVVIFGVALAVTILCGVVLQMAENKAREESVYLPERLISQANQPVLTEAQLRGIWVYQAGKYIMTLKIGGGVFELISRYTDDPVSRYFVRGGYKTNGNVLILQERKDLGTPIDPEHLEYQFYPMAMGNINLYAQSNGQIMNWATPSKELRRLDNVEEEVQIIFGENVSWVKISAQP